MAVSRILVLSKRYEASEIYVDVSTDEQFNKAVLKLLVYRFLKKNRDAIAKVGAEDFGITSEEVNKMREGQAKNLIISYLERFEEDRIAEEKSLKIRKMAENIVERQDGARAWAFLQANIDRQDTTTIVLRDVLAECPEKLLSK